MPKKTDKKDQYEKFKAAAKEHGCSESEKEFSAKVKKLATRQGSSKKD